MNSPSSDGPLSVTISPTVPYWKMICSIKKDASALAFSEAMALSSALPDKSSQQATIQFFPWASGIFMTSRNGDGNVVLPLFLRLSDAGTMAYKTSLDVSELLWTSPTQRTLQRSSPKIL